MLSAVAATGLIGAKGAGFESSGEKTDISLQQAAMPTIALGPHRISRLICGSNQFLGYSYMGPHVDQHMKEYFNTQLPHKRHYILRWLPQADMLSNEGDDSK